MSKQFTEEKGPIPSGRVTVTAAYSAHIQEAMRYDKLRSSDYPIVMSIMHAVSQGLTEEQWKTEQQNTVGALLNKPPEKEIGHSDAADRYEQTIARLEDLVLWPW